MKLLDKIADWVGYTKKTGLTYADIWLSGNTLPQDATVSGIDSNLQVAAVYACVRVLAETLASVPLIVYQRIGQNGRRRATDFYLYRLLHDQPNARQTSFEWREMLQGHLGLRGNAFCEIIWRGNEVQELLPLNPANMRVEQNSGVVEYIEQKERRRIAEKDILHLRGLCSDGVIGMSPIAAAQKTISLARRAEKYGESVFTTGAAQRVLLKHPGILDAEAQGRLKKSWDSIHAGTATTAILEQGMDAVTIGMSAEDAQFLETRKFQVEEIARLYRVPLHLIGMLDKATYSNIEHQSLEFVKYTMLPWFRRWEQALTKALLGADSEYFVEFLVDGLLRGDAVSRARSNQIQLMHGAMSIDEWRAQENRNPLPDGLGTYHYVPVNLQRVDNPTAPQTEQQPEEITQEEEPQKQIIQIEEQQPCVLCADIQVEKSRFRDLLREHFHHIMCDVLKSLPAAVAAGNGKIDATRLWQHKDAWAERVRAIAAKHYASLIDAIDIPDIETREMRRITARHLVVVAKINNAIIDKVADAISEINDQSEIENAIREEFKNMRTYAAQIAVRETQQYIDDLNKMLMEQNNGRRNQVL